jgi:hypothetical protein
MEKENILKWVTAARTHKIMENPNGFLERIDTIPMEKEHLPR